MAFDPNVSVPELQSGFTQKTNVFIYESADGTGVAAADYFTYTDPDGMVTTGKDYSVNDGDIIHVVDKTTPGATTVVTVTANYTP